MKKNTKSPLSPKENENKNAASADSGNTSYVPVPVDGFDFPVGASFISLDKLHLNIIHWHWHEEIEFLIINSGHVLLIMSDETILLSPGEGVFLNQNQLHSLRARDGENCSLYTLKFHPAFLFGYGQTTLSAKYLTPVLSSPDLHYLMLREDDPVSSEILTLVSDTLACCLAKRFGYELKVKSLLCSLWALLLPFATPAKELSGTSGQASLDGTRIKQALSFIEEKHMEPLTLEEIASSIHVSKSECCRCFQRSIGITPFEYLLKFRIFESTKKMMRQDEVAKSISTLAASVGFNSTSYYNKLFKKYLNCTPSEYKKSLQKFASKNPENTL